MNNKNNPTNLDNQLYLAEKNIKPMESNIYFYKDSGSFGVVVYDDYNVLFKILDISTCLNELSQDKIERNNLIEIIMLSNIKNSINVIQSKNFFYHNNKIDKGKIKLGIFQPSIYHKCPWVIKESSILVFNELKMYKGNLFSIINKSNINFLRKNFIQIAKQLIKGLSSIHAIGLLHGDIKSSNILYNFNEKESEQIVLIDFGGVKPINSQEYFKTCTMTTRCPEDLKYDIDYDSPFINSGIKSDIWSLGIVFTELLLGYNPISILYNEYKSNYDNEEIIEKKLSSEFKKIEFIDVEKLIENKIKNEHIEDRDLIDKLRSYAKIVKKMLYINPIQRVNSLDEIYQDLTESTLEIIQPKFNYIYPNINNEIFLEFRKEFYLKIILLFLKVTIGIDYALPYLVDLTDRFFSKFILIKEIDSISVIELEAIGVCMVYLTCIWYESELVDFSIIQNKVQLQYLKFDSMKDYLLQIIVFMDYDMYRPWFNVNTQLDITGIVIRNIKNKIIGLDPEFYT